MADKSAFFGTPCTCNLSNVGYWPNESVIFGPAFHTILAMKLNESATPISTPANHTMEMSSLCWQERTTLCLKEKLGFDHCHYDCDIIIPLIVIMPMQVSSMLSFSMSKYHIIVSGHSSSVTITKTTIFITFIIQGTWVTSTHIESKLASDLQD